MSDVMPGTARVRLARALASGITAATALAEALTAERAALAAQDANSLESIAKTKLSCLQQLEADEQERQSVLQQTGFADDRDGMSALTEWCAADAELADQWKRYLAIAQECQEANNTNGAILRLRHQQIASALGALSGCTPQTYGPSGSNDSGGTRALAQA